MYAFKDRLNRRFFICFIIFVFMLVLSDVVLTATGFAVVKRGIYNEKLYMCSSLLEQGADEAVIAEAVTSEAKSRGGEELLKKLGITENTEALYIPTAQSLEIKFFAAEAVRLFALSAFLFAFIMYFILKREKLYKYASEAILNDEPLPKEEEGRVYRLFEQINNVTASLKSNREAHKNAKDFLKQTVSDISHRLKTPLSAMSMYNEIILDEPENAVAVADFAKKSQTALERMKTLITELLKITRLDSGGIIFDKKPYPVSEIIEASVENLRSRAEREGKRLVIKTKKERLCCDFNWTAEAIENIVKNALDHTERGGEINISCEPTPLETRLLIEDNGVGISPEDFHHVFKRFYRSKNSSDSNGAGLGLPIAKAVVEGQGGVICFNSLPRRGTLFILSFPNLTEL